MSGYMVRAQEQFTYNRFQYHNYSWEVLHTPAFHIYFPKGNDSVASFASLHLPDIMEELGRDMGITIRDVPNLIIYPSPDQLYESNIGLYDQKVQTFPTINLKGNRVLLAFDGSWERLRSQLKEAWARLCWESQFKEDIEEQLTNKQQLIPAWFKEGAIRYYSQGWQLEDETLWTTRLSKEQDNFEFYASNDKALAGQAFCHFLSLRYRTDALRQLVFQMRQGKSLARAARLVTKRRLDTLQQQCVQFYRERAGFYHNGATATVDTLQHFLEKRFKGKLFDMSFDRDSRTVYFVIEKDNKRNLYSCPVLLLNKNRRIKPFARYLMPPWLDAYERDPYPLMDRQDKDRVLFVLLPHKGIIELRQYDDMGVWQHTNKLYGTDGVNDVHALDKGRFLLSAFRKGRGDIVQYDARKLGYTAMTADKGDHTELAVNKQEGLMAYRSGFPVDSLYHKDTLAKPYGVYTKSIKGEAKKVAKQQDQAVSLDSAYISAHHPEYDEDGNLTVQLSYAGILQRNNPKQAIVANAKPSPWLKDYLQVIKSRDSVKAILDKLKADDVPLMANLLPSASKEQVQQHKDSLRKSLAYTPKKVRPYILQLYSAYFSAQANNDYYINRYQPYQSYLGSFKFPEVGAMAQGGFSDLFDNHQFNIGYRMPSGTEGSDFFVRYANKAKKLDWHLLYFRKMESLKPGVGSGWEDEQGNPYPLSAKVRTHYYELGFHYPIHYDWSLDLVMAARNDRTIFLATDRYSLNYDPLKTLWSINTLSLDVHKLKAVGTFLSKGLEAKMLLDGMVSTGKASTMLYGARIKAIWHQPLFANINLVTRVQAGHSGGRSKILYNFGGTDNNVVPRVDTSVRFSQDAPYAFQTLVTPFRGYEQNSIYGSSFALVNLDLYFPLFQGILNWQPSFPMLRNLQLGVFADMAATRNVVLPSTTPSSLYAYGVSARTQLAGYPIRFDLAWPGSFDKQPVWYLSLSFK